MLFTSDTRNLHGTYPIESGVRYAMPMWQSDLSMIERNDELLDNFLDRLWNWCPAMGGFDGLPIPSKFNTDDHVDEIGYIEDCDAFLEDIEAIIDESIEENRKHRRQ